jgi:two-component system KDP operon response regulator KdpE
LESNGYIVDEATTASEGIVQVSMKRPDIIILDIELTDSTGLDFLKKLREWNETPVLVLSVRNSEEDKIKLLDAGADDYITKPFSMGELLARLRVMLRHKAPALSEGIFKNGELSIDYSKRLVTVNNVEIKLTPTEYSLLVYIAKHIGKVITHNQIMKEVWGPNFVNEHNYLRVYITQLRKKIEKETSRPEYIITEPGVGYRMIWK